MEDQRTIPKADVIEILRRAKIDEAVIAELDSELPDPVDYDRDGPIFTRHGITRGVLIDRMGGSP